jgi:hypothetical protein
MDEALKVLNVQLGVKSETQAAGQTYPLPSGTRWADVAIRVSHLRMTVDVNGGKVCIVDPKDIPAFYDSRKKGMVNSDLWTLFDKWAVDGEVSGTSKQISQIRLALKNYFSITENPLPYQHQLQKWKTAFILAKAKD